MYLKVDYNTKDDNCCQKVHKIWQVLAIEGFTKASYFVLSCCQEMEKCDNGTFKFRSYNHKQLNLEEVQPCKLATWQPWGHEVLWVASLLPHRLIFPGIRVEQKSQKKFQP